MHDLDAIFAPQSVAVIGASAKPGKVGHDIFNNILRGGFSGTLFPVNPSTRSISCVKAYPSIRAIEEDVDMAMVILPPSLALDAVTEAAEKGVKGIVIVSAGFREVGAEGARIEQRIVAICREAGIRLVGPNCLGVINPMPDVKLNASFSARMPSPGKISFISQSGALCTAVLDFAADRDFGFSKFISIGNKADVDELDLLRYLHADPHTEVIIIYLEELRRGPEFVETVKEITSGFRRTPVLVIKSGRTAAGAQAAASHTGALAGSEAVYDAIFKQCGIIRADSIGELFDFASAFAYKEESALGKMRRKLPSGNRVAIVTNAGGPGIVATDMTVSSGLQLARFHQDTIDTLASHLPETANLRNPVDVIGDATRERYENALAAVIGDDDVDGALVILTPQSMTDALGTAQAIVQVAHGSHKPILCCFMGIVDVSPGVQYLQSQGYPVYRFPEDAAKAFGALFRYSQWVNRERLPTPASQHDKKRADAIIQEALAEGKTYLGELEGGELLKCYGLHMPITRLAGNAAEAVAIADEISYPVVMKIVSPHIIHKSDAGGVAVGLKTPQAVADAFDHIVKRAVAYRADAVIRGVLVQQMVPSGAEAIIGMNRYPVFGPLLMFGLGGIYVELFGDVTFRLAPVSRTSAHRMIREIKGYRLFTGFRGMPEADLETVEQILLAMSDLAINHPQIKEMDINPLMIHETGRGATVADCRIILSQECL